MRKFTGFKDKNGTDVFVGDSLDVPPNLYCLSCKHIVFEYKGEFVTMWEEFEDINSGTKRSLQWILEITGATVVKKS